MSNDVEEVDGCICEKETAKAILVLFPHGTRSWIPKSVVHDDSEVYGEHPDAREGKLVIARWFAEKEGIG